MLAPCNLQETLPNAGTYFCVSCDYYKKRSQLFPYKKKTKRMTFLIEADLLLSEVRTESLYRVFHEKSAVVQENMKL